MVLEQNGLYSIFIEIQNVRASDESHDPSHRTIALVL